MKIGIIGAGFTGLAAAYELVTRGYSVTVFEKDQEPGGLAIGYKEKKWQWSLEKYYHHWFVNDATILSLAQEINYPVIMKRPVTSVYVNHEFFQLDSPKALMSFPNLSIVDRIRMACVLSFLRYNPLWQPLEYIKTTSFLKTTMGKKSYEMLWEPQLSNKFGEYSKDISLSWFWARIKKRTSSLAYPQEGFLSFAHHFVNTIKKGGGNMYFNTEVKKIEKKTDGVHLTVAPSERTVQKDLFDKVIVTLPSFFFVQITPQLPTSYTRFLLQLKGLGASNMILRLSERFLPNNTYWLSICQKESPIMAIVEHTNFMNQTHYNNEHIVYLGNYLAQDDDRYQKNEKDLLKLYDPLLRKINAKYYKNLIGYKVFKVPFAQPIISVGYSKLLPPFQTPLSNVFLANIQQVYPWDRGTNYAVELGQKVAQLILSNTQ